MIRFYRLLAACGLATSTAFAQTAPPAAQPPAPAAVPAQPAPVPAAQPVQPAPVQPLQPAPPPAAQPNVYPAQPAPQPAPQPATAYPAAPAPQPAPAPAPQVNVAGQQQEQPPPAAKKVPLNVFRFGYGAFASGALDFQGQCSGSCPLSLRNGEENVSDKTRALLGFDLMFGPEPVSMGVGFWFTTGTTLESDKLVFSERSIGWEFATPFMLGAAVPATETIAVRFGAFGGPEFLFADGGSAQGRDGDAYESLCDDLGSQVSSCDTSFPTRFSFIYGVQAGPVFRVSKVNTIGVEAVLQRVDLELFNLDAEGPGWRAKQTYDYGAWKLWLMLSLGLGK